MKLHFVEAHALISVKLPKKVIDALPQRIAIATDAQFIRQLPQIVKQLENGGKTVATLKGAHAKHLGQILGCSHIKLDYPEFTEAFLYVGDGMFHPKALLIGSEKEVYTYNPLTKEFGTLGQAEVAMMKKKQKGALLKFLHSSKVAVLIAVKPGQIGIQAHIGSIYSLEKRFPEKKFYYIAFDTLDFAQLANFPFVEVFVNTACTRLMDDYDKFPKPMVNINEILNL